MVGREEGGAAGPAVDPGRLDGGAQVFERRHVVDGVVDEDAVERPVEADGAHVALDVPALGVELLAHRQHPGRQVDEGHLEVRLEVGGVVAAAAAEFEGSSGSAVRGFEQVPEVDAGFLLVLVGR